MDVYEALRLTFKTLGELDHAGIEVALRPSRSRFIPETVERYNRPGRLAPEYWFSANLKAVTQEQADLIFESANELARIGICFDTGGGCGGRDWELDWSLHVEAFDSDYVKQMEEGRGVVEDMINQMPDPEPEDLESNGVN